ncbi:hypothetical protein AQUCO_02200036v1 [Aquilegia coerulea]|uniref:Myb-like domain-containing protein n=1 Tax=Aquilegia coerulea TaxID=218851 RepID=A0A2G5DCY9_AQUCA|nr:hypothetical protein AQUCO_02200036v1 [Aquilegia coerulea]
MDVLNVNRVQFSSPNSPHFLGSSTCVAKHPEWTRDENKIFEQALCEVDHNSQTLYEDIAARLPGKTVTEVVRHYLALSHDLKVIESGNYTVPKYEDYQKGIVDSDSKANNQPPSSQTNLGRRKKAPNWSKEEHKYVLICFYFSCALIDTLV